MVAETDGALDPEIIRRFLGAFQAITPLDIGELWALPLMLRLQLLECLAPRDPGRPTAKGKRGGRFLGKSAYHRRPAQLHRDCSK
jgi:Putative homoserine kinase type II (protein kinase fold)